MYLPVSGSSATTEPRYRLSPPLGLRALAAQGEPLPVPTYIRLSSGSKAKLSQAVPPPPASQYLPLGSQVLAARAIDSSSKGLLGSPGTTNQRHFWSPVFAS
ncbi:hypothetical protein D3C72_1126720 [compost metagenome]